MAKEELRAEVCCVCKIKVDLAQCPECHLWFCKQHDTHECIPEQVAHLQNRIAAIKNRRSWGEHIIYLGVIMGFGYLAGMIEGLADVGFNWDMHSGSVVTLTTIVVTPLVLGYIIWRHYNHQLRQSGVRFRHIRP